MYELAAKLAKLAESGQSYKTALYSIKNKKKIKSVHFLAGNAVRRRELIDELLKRVGLADEVDGNVWLGRVAVAELLWGRWRLPSSTPLFRKIAQAKDKLLKILPAVEKETDYKDDVQIPRYIRLNTELFTKSSAVSKLKQLGFELLETPPTYAQFLSRAKSLKKKQFLFDFNVPNLLVFHGKAKIVELSPIEFIRQDKSSCLVGLILAPVAGCSILDMCAAPGYKSQHAASLIYNLGTVFSVDINKERYKTLESTCKRFGLEGVCHPINMDALKVSAEICPNVEYIIVDPPCSGTGMMSVLVRHTADEGRLSKLSNLQAMILKHALSQFPSARRIVYSTCSIQEEENEQVVGECLSVAEQNGFQLVPLGGSLRGSFSQGIGSSRVAASVLRLSPQYHLTNGFFIALFERSTPPKIPLFKSKTETLSKSETNKYEALKEDSLSSYSVSNSEDEICDEDKDIILKKSDVKSRNRNKPTVENSRENSRLLKKNSSAKNINKTCLSKGTKQSNTLSSIKCIKIEYTHSRQIKKKILPKKQLRKK